MRKFRDKCQGRPGWFHGLSRPLVGHQCRNQRIGPIAEFLGQPLNSFARFDRKTRVISQGQRDGGTADARFVGDVLHLHRFGSIHLTGSVKQDFQYWQAPAMLVTAFV